MVAPWLWRGAALGALVIVGAGCGDDGGDAPPSCLPECPASRGYDAEAYHLRARFDAGARVLRASEDITLALEQPIVELDAAVNVTGVHAGDQKLAYAVDEDLGVLRVNLGPVIGDAAPVTFTVEYDAPLSGSLIYGGPRDDDPVMSRVLFTDSEPDRARFWLVGNVDTRDRAQFSVELTVAAGDDVVSNGERVRDDTAGGERTVGYALGPPIPMYLMAFAAGALEHTDRTTGRVPLSVWHRRGLVLDPAATLDAVAAQIAFFEERVGPYPWDRYAVVYLPQFGGGMENATITFNTETAGQGVIHFSLNAHELAHQWFGDHVTMDTIDDLWTKEGTATFLAAEAELANRDREHRGRMFGADFLFLNSTAVIDPSLPPQARYTDGPYGRAAWVITQIRRRVGEEAFWAGLRKVLADHALGDVTSEEYVRAFAPALDEPTIQKVLASLRSHEGSELTVTSTTVGAALDVELSLSDPAGVVIAPIEVTVVDAAGAATTHAVAEGAPATFTVPAGAYAAPDERGVHPSWPRTFDAGGADLARLSARTAPASFPAGPALAAYLSRSAAHQERAIAGALQVPPGGDFRAVHDALDSTVAQETLLTWTCAQLVNLGEPSDLVAALEPLLRAPSLARYNTGFMRCPTDLAARALGAEFGTLVTAPAAGNIARLEYLLGFDYGTAVNFARLTSLVTGAPSLRLRERALGRMISETTLGAPHRIPDADRPTWRAFFRSQYAIVRTQTRFGLVWQGSVNLADLEALPIVAPMLHSVPLSDGAQTQVVCDAFRMTRSAPASWTAFQEAARPWDTLAQGAQLALANPDASCDLGRRRLVSWDLVDDGDERGRLGRR